MSWPFYRKPVTETGATYYLRDAAVSDLRTLIDFKHRVWRRTLGHLKDADFFAAAEATSAAQIAYWRSGIARGKQIWLAEDLRDRVVGTIHATAQHSDHTEAFLAEHQLGAVQEIRCCYLGDAATATLARALLDRAVGEQPAITWLMGETPLLAASLREAGFQPWGEPVDPATAPWQGVPRQAMVRA